MCRGYFLAGPFDLRPGCSPDKFFELTPHWLPMSFAETAPAPRALEIAWQQAGGSLEIPVRPHGGRADTLDFRIAGEPGARLVEFDVRVRVASGAWVPLGARPLGCCARITDGARSGKSSRGRCAWTSGPRVLPCATSRPSSSPRARRAGVSGCSTFRRASSVWPTATPSTCRGSASRDVVVAEGDAGDFTVNLPIVIDGEVTRPAKLWVQLTDYADFEQPTRGLPARASGGRDLGVGALYATRPTTCTTRSRNSSRSPCSPRRTR